jgi:hypothetical protein
MEDVRRSEAVNQEIAEHVQRLHKRLAEGRDEIARQRESVGSTRQHIDELRRWTAETERHLRAQRRDDEAA